MKTKREKLPDPLPRLTEAQFCACVLRPSDIRARMVGAFAVLVSGIELKAAARVFEVDRFSIREAIRDILKRDSQIRAAYSEWEGSLYPLTEKQFYCCLFRLERWEAHHLEMVYEYFVLNQEPKAHWHHRFQHTQRILSRHLQFLLAYTDLQPEDIRHA